MDKIEWCCLIDNTYGSIKVFLIQAFTEYYGDEYRDKIEYVINNLVIMKMCPNFSTEDFEKENNKILIELAGLIKKLSTLVGVDTNKIITMLEKNSADNFIKIFMAYPKSNLEMLRSIVKLNIKYQYYRMSLHEKINNEDTSILLGRNDKNLSDSEKSKLDRQVKKGKKESVLEAYHFMYYPAIGLKQSYINIHSLIHEINHLLREKVELLLPINNGLDKRDKWYGVNCYNSSNDLFYEIINDLMAKEIFYIFNKYYRNKNNYLLENEISNSKYLAINDRTEHIIENIYKSNKDRIKKILIDVGGDEFVFAIGLKNYGEFNKKIESVYNNISKVNYNISESDFYILKNIGEEISCALGKYQDVDNKSK